MPKRIPTPPPGDDEPRYLTVVHPYPPHANMELETDRKVFAFWLACCIGKDNLYAFFHKPLSPNMVIIEVNRNFPDFNNLLGEHRWRNFLRKPSQDEEDRVSKVFYCTYSTGREVQKYGWKRIFVEERWFKEWSPQNILIAYPYPVTYRCEVPSEDKTREPLCRPLPVQAFPPPPPIRPPPVGSPAWIDDKQSASAEAVNAHGGAWARGTPAATRAKGVPPSLTISDVQRPGSSLSSAPAPSGSSPDRNDIGAWGRWPSPSPSSIGTPPGIPIQSGLKAPSTSSNSIASSAIGSGTAQELPPLEHNSSSTSPQLSATSSEGDESGWWPAVSTLNNNVVVANQGFERVMEGLSIEDDMDSAAEDGCAVPAPAQEPKNLWTTAAPVQVYKSLWANEEESQEPQLTLLCTEHGVTCKKGICKVYAAQLKAQQRAEREKKREKEREKRAARGVDKGRGKNKGKGETGDASTGSTNSPGRSNAWKVRPMPGVNPVRPRPPHLIKGASGAKDGDAAPPPARGAAPSAPPVKRNNSNTRPPAATVAEKDARSAGGSMATWGNPSKGPSASQASKHDNDDARSVAASTASGWGNISEGPWRTDNNAEGKQPSRSWADQVQDEDDARSVTASTTGGWGHLSESGMPW